MTIRRCGSLSVLAAATLLTYAASASAEATRRGDDTARLQMMLQQVTSEKTTLAAENAKLKADLDKIKAQLEAASKERDAGTQKLLRNQQDLVTAGAKTDALQRSFDTLKGRFEQLVEKFRETARALSDVEQDRSRLQNLTSEYEARVSLCERNNDALYKSNLELIDLYEHKGVMTALMQREPVTQLKKVQIQNLMDQYRSLAEEMRLAAPAPVNPTSAEAPASASAEPSGEKSSDL